MLPPVGAAPAITTRKSGTRCARSSSRSWKLSTKSFRGGWCNGDVGSAVRRGVVDIVSHTSSLPYPDPPPDLEHEPLGMMK